MSLSIDGTSYLNVLQSSGTISNSNVKGLENTLNNTNLKDSTDEDLMEVCESFESYFVEQVFKEMKKTVHSSDDEGEYMKYFGDMYTQSIVEKASGKEGFGIAKMLYESMKRNS